MAGLTAFAASYSQHYSGFAKAAGVTATTAGMVVSATMAGKLVGNLTLGGLADKLGTMKASFVCLAGCVFGMTLMLFGHGNITILMMGAFFGGFLNTFLSVYVPLPAKSSFGLRAYAQIFSLISVGTSVIGAFGASGVGLLYDITGDYNLAWGIGIGICILIVIITVAVNVTAKNLIWEKKAL